MGKINSKIVDRMISLKKDGLKMVDIASILNVSERTILKYTSHIKHPNNKYFVLNNKYKKLSSYKAEVLGFLAAEGCEIKYTTNFNYKDSRRPKPYLYTTNFHKIIFTNKNDAIISRFIYLMNFAYGYNPKPRTNGDIEINVKEIKKDLLEYSNFGSRKWNVPNKIIKGSKNLKVSWLRGYGDGDGSVDVSKKEIFFKSINFNSLKNVKLLLDSLKIESHFRGPYLGAYLLVTKDLLKYYNNIGFSHPNKLKKLKSLIIQKN